MSQREGESSGTLLQHSVVVALAVIVLVHIFSTNCKRTLPGPFRNNPKHSVLTQTNQIRCCCTHVAASQPKPRVEMKE